MFRLHEEDGPRVVYDDFLYKDYKPRKRLSQLFHCFLPNLKRHSRRTPIVVSNSLHNCLPDLDQAMPSKISDEGSRATWLTLITKASSSCGLSIIEPLP
ncbi:unnamed protein product [Dibothriocephalus latus]|uniref:Uncharacterized protein n=1 Tax=Dibothriocephalus latus TaxID=60516 RepID=A0A3P6QFW6_DIBLA|nr:unnamed protein product [Dibothriocephalus latus]